MVATMAFGRRSGSTDGRIRYAERPGRGDVFEVTATQEFGAYKTDQRDPREQQQNPSRTKNPGTRIDDRIKSR